MFISIHILIRQLMDLHKFVHSNYNNYNLAKKNLFFGRTYMTVQFQL
jgi:hypothetical protein